MPLRLTARRHCQFILALFFFISATINSHAQDIPSPESFLGHPVGADYELARWDQILEYFRILDERSDRVAVHDLGPTSEGRRMIYAEISSPDTIADTGPHKHNQERIADPRKIVSPEEERLLAEQTKVPVLINCSLHASEVAAAQMSMELAYNLATGEDERTRQILDRVIVILVPSANPDGLEIVASWYETTIGKPWEGGGLPFLYHKYAGHDNNRDWFMLNLIETQHETRLIYKEWRPTIVYDVHQMGNSSARFFVPPFHDPKNANVPPLVDQTLLIIGGHMAQELSREGKTGVIHGAIYDNWWAGGFRTTVYRHNMIGILTEAASANTASPIFQSKGELRGARRGLPEYEMQTNHPEPWPGGWWRLRDIVEYELIACMSLFTYAARYHDTFQGNFIHLGRQAIETGQNEPPFAWLVPPDQRDPRSAAWMLDLLDQTAIEIHEAEEAFTADGVQYPEGTFILYCAQPYRGHLMDMMERQVYPDREMYPGGPAEPPYDTAGWTLPLQMGVRRIAVSGPFEANAHLLDAVPVPQGRLDNASGNDQYVILAGRNDDFRLLNRLADAGIEVSVYTEDHDWTLPTGERVPAGSFVIRDGARLRGAMPDVMEGVSVIPMGIAQIPEDANEAIKPARAPRIGLYQPWTTSMDEGWTRYVLDTFEYDYTTVHNADILAGNLADRYDCIVFPSIRAGTIINGRPPDSSAPQYVGGITIDGVVALQEFARDGGTLVLMDDATDLAVEHFNIPVKNVIRGKPSSEFYCPGSILRVSIDPNHALGWGLPEWISAYFSGSQAFAVEGDKRFEPKEEEEKSDTAKKEEERKTGDRFPTTIVARYSDTILLESGWIRGDELIKDAPCIAEVKYGEGQIVLLGFAVQNRAQSHGTFRLLFNAMQRSTIP